MIKQWQIDAEVKNVGKASPYWGQQTGANSPSPDLTKPDTTYRSNDFHTGNSGVPGFSYVTPRNSEIHTGVGGVPGFSYVPPNVGSNVGLGFNPFNTVQSQAQFGSVGLPDRRTERVERIRREAGQALSMIDSLMGSVGIKDRLAEKVSRRPDFKFANFKRPVIPPGQMVASDTYRLYGDTPLDNDIRKLSEIRPTAAADLSPGYYVYGPGELALAMNEHYGGERFAQTADPAAHLARGTGAEGGYDFHPAIPRPLRSNFPVLAPANGVVVFSGYMGNRYGNTVVVQDNNGNMHLQAHLKDLPIVPVGTTVDANTMLGNIGADGINVDGEHIHYEFIPNGQLVDNRIQGQRVAEDRYFRQTYPFY